LQRWLTPARPNWVKGRFDRALPHALGIPSSGPSEANVDDKPRNVRRLPEFRPAEKIAVREIERQRAESIYAWDVEFGRIVKKLKETGEYARTVFFFTSDNGYFNGEHRHRSGKIKAYEPVLHVPLVVAGPGIRTGVRYTPITTMDLTATVLDLADAGVLPAMDGSSKLSAMTGDDPGWNRVVVTEGLIKGLTRTADSGVPAGFTTSGIRTGRYKLIRYATGEGELYDLWVDPLELSNKWTVASYRPIRTQLLQLWAKYRMCRTTACREILPVSFRASPAWLAEQDGRATRAKRDYYR
jgi:arylsulfatase A-like enzyme